MTALRVYVIGHGVSMIYHAMSALGFDSDTIQAVLYSFATIMYSTFGDLAAVLLFPVIYIYNLTQNLNISLPQWVTDTYNFVFGTIAYYWSWLVNTVYDLSRAWSSLPDTISYYVNAAFSGIQYLLDWLSWLRNAAGSLINYLLYSAAEFVWNNLPSWVKQVIADASQWLNVLVSFYEQSRAFITQFLSDPLGFVLGAWVQYIRTIIQVVSSDWQYFSWLFGEGKKLITDLLNNPADTLLSKLADTFIDWLLQLISDNW